MFSRSWQVKWLMSLYPPLLFNRVVVKHVSSDFLRLEVLIRKSILNRNLQGSIFGGSLFSAADPYPAVQYWNRMRQLGIPCQAWLKRSEIDYLKPATTDIKLVFTITEEQIELAKKSLEETGRFDGWHEVSGIDKQGREVVRIKSLMVLKISESGIRPLG